ncbi:LptF/LptG family permease [Natronospora cellulosivora (SeqCode)]
MQKLWKKRIIDIYLMKEVLIPYIVGVAIITVIGLSNFLFQLTDLIIVKNISIDIVMRLLIYQLPDIIVQTFPIAVLFATIHGMSRLNRENEFTALRLGGVSLYRLILPLVILGILISVLTYQMNERVVPWTNHEAQNIIRRHVLMQTMPDVRDNVFFQGPEGRLFFVSEFDEQNDLLEKIVVYNLPRGNDFPEMITASSGRVDGNVWHLEGGIIHQFDSDGELYHGLIFDHMEYEVASEMETFFGEQRTTSEMNRERLKRDIDLFQRSGIKVVSLLIDYHLKLSMPLAALIFILVGTPLSLSSKDSRSASIVITIVIIFLYYLVLSLSQSFGKNERIPPLLAAWLPNIIFGILGILLMVLREKWQNWASKFIPFFSVSILLLGLLFSGQAVQAESLNITYADQLSFDQEQGKYVLSGEIMGQYSKFNIFAETVTIVMEDGSEMKFTKPEKIDMEKSKFTGCDLHDPHYYFDAREVRIYPGDYLVAKHVSFWELSGKLPLMYWPYLYISLKEDDQSLIPEYGYNAERGWYIRTTYNYRYNRLPGQLYVDYYTISGFAGGFKQHFFYDHDLEAYLYLYGQENRTSIPGLFVWQGEIDIQNERSSWETDTNVKFDYYENYSDLRGNVNVTNREDDWLFNLDSDFKRKNYFNSEDKDDRDLELELKYEHSALPYDLEYFLRIENDYRHNPEDGLSSRWAGLSYLSRQHTDNLEYRLTFERDAPDFRSEDDEEDKVAYFRWPEFELNYHPRGPLDYKMQLGRYYEDDLEIEALRAHGEVKYDKVWNFNNVRFTTEHDIKGRIYKEYNSENYFETGRNSNNIFNPNLNPYTYQGLPYQIAYNTNSTARITLLPGLTWTNRYRFTDFIGESPFDFDKISKNDVFNSDLNYRRGDWTARLGSGYDLSDQLYLPLIASMTWRITQALNLSMDTRYDINEAVFTRDLRIVSNYRTDKLNVRLSTNYDINDNIFDDFVLRTTYNKENLSVNFATSYNIHDNRFGDIVFTNKYKGEHWEINNGFKYDLENYKLEEIDNQIIFELEDEWYFELNNSYDNLQERFDTANLALRKNFHCRTLTFKYDYVKQEYTLEYNINLFPEQTIQIGSSAEDEFMFDFGLDELIDMED